MECMAVHEESGVMRMKKGCYPIVIGKNMRKGILAFRDAEHNCFNVLIVWLKKDYQSGSAYSMKDVDGVNAVLRFCDRESVKLTIDTLNLILKNWK